MSPGRWKSGSSASSKRSAQATSPAIAPLALPAPIRASPTLTQSSPSALGAATVTLAARGPSGSNSVNQSEPVAGAPGRLWTV